MSQWVDSLALSVVEYATGANGNLKHHEQVSRLADGTELVDWCYEYLDHHGTSLVPEAMTVVRRLVAHAMLRQHSYDMEIYWDRPATTE
jgi:hypothetical protein